MKTVLLADDMDLLREMLRDLLESMNIQVLESVQKEKTRCGCDAVLCACEFIRKSSWAVGFDVNAGGSGSGHGKGNRVLRTGQAS
jgi:hypothetical protein